MQPEDAVARLEYLTRELSKRFKIDEASSEPIEDQVLRAIDGALHDQVMSRVTSSIDARRNAPIPIRMPCPRCGELHVDEGKWSARIHTTHECQSCGEVWRPAVVATVGVRFLTQGHDGDETL